MTFVFDQKFGYEHDFSKRSLSYITCIFRPLWELTFNSLPWISIVGVFHLHSSGLNWRMCRLKSLNRRPLSLCKWPDTIPIFQTSISLVPLKASRKHCSSTPCWMYMVIEMYKQQPHIISMATFQTHLSVCLPETISHSPLRWLNTVSAWQLNEFSLFRERWWIFYVTNSCSFSWMRHRGSGTEMQGSPTSKSREPLMSLSHY